MYQGVNASEGIGIGSVMVAVDPDLTLSPTRSPTSPPRKERYQALGVFCEGQAPGGPHEDVAVGENEAEIMWPATSSWPRTPA